MVADQTGAAPKDSVPKNADFTTNALQNAVSSAFSKEPIDNDQVFITRDKTSYRIIVKGYSVYFDGSRTMLVYFIPFLNTRNDDDVERVLTLLQIISYFRSDFLQKEAPYRISEFDLYQHDFPAFRKQVLAAMRKLLLGVAASHNCGLDNPGNFRKFLGEDNVTSSSQISQMYSVGEAATSRFLDTCAKFNAPITNELDLMNEWRTSRVEYLNYAKEANLKLGLRTLERLKN